MKSNKKDDAVSPTIGVILMMAVTVILAAAIGNFVLGLGSSEGERGHPYMSYEVQSAGEHVLLEYEKHHQGVAKFHIPEIGKNYTIEEGKDKGIIVLENYNYSTVNIIREYKGDKFVEASYVRINNKWESVK